MRLKIILFILATTVIGCFYLQSQQIIELKHRIEILEKESVENTKRFKETNNILKIIIKEIQRTSKFIA